MPRFGVKHADMNAKQTRTSPLADHLCPFPAPAMLKTKGMNRENKERS